MAVKMNPAVLLVKPPDQVVQKDDAGWPYELNHREIEYHIRRPALILYLFSDFPRQIRHLVTSQTGGAKKLART